MIILQNQVGAAPHTVLGQHVGHVELHCALGEIHARGDFLVRQILEQGLIYLALARAQAAHLAGNGHARLVEDSEHEAREQEARHPVASLEH